MTDPRVNRLFEEAIARGWSRRQMLRAGALIDLAAAVVIACVAYYTVSLIGSHR